MYDELINKRETEVDGVSNWMWTKIDNGSWDGPHQEWKELKEIFLKHCKSFESVVCAGGNHGLYPRLLSNTFKHVYTFEPDSLNFHSLVNNCQKENIYKFNAALGSAHDMIGISTPHKENRGMTIVGGVGYVPVLMIDDFVFETLSLIQLDVEGFECHVLDGAESNIRKHKPLITAENGDTKYISEFLSNLGYELIGKTGADSIYLNKN